MQAAQFAELFVTPSPPPSGEKESPPPLPTLDTPPSLVLPHQVVVMDDINEVNCIHWRPFPAVVSPQSPQRSFKLTKVMTTMTTQIVRPVP
jgi:hypothetical protein